MISMLNDVNYHMFLSPIAYEIYIYIYIYLYIYSDLEKEGKLNYIA